MSTTTAKRDLIEARKDANLTPMESEHLRLLRLGLTAREAAKYLSRELATVQNARSSLRRKIGEHDYEEARFQGEQSREGMMIERANSAA